MLTSSAKTLIVCLLEGVRFQTSLEDFSLSSL